MTARNTLNAFQAEEIDVAFWNEGDPAGLRMFDHILLVECKNWTAPAGYPELAVFNDKLTSRGLPMGIFVAAAGITGTPAALTAAHEVLARALSQGREIIVLTRREIEELADTADLVLLLKRKRAQLAVSGNHLRAGQGRPAPLLRRRRVTQRDRDDGNGGFPVAVPWLSIPSPEGGHSMSLRSWCPY